MTSERGVSVICPQCQTANREGASFCRRCGRLLGEACPRCGATPAPEADFCDNCGLALTPEAQFAWRPFARVAEFEAVALSAPAAAAPAPPAGAARPPAAGRPAQSLQAYIPQEFRAKLEAARDRGEMVGERRVVTMLFSDVQGSTAAAERLDPEDWSELINGAFQHMIQPVYRYEGTVARLMGDAILAFFGAPIAHEDDPQRAVLAGLDIIEAVRGYREQVKQRWGIDFDVRIGINTGLVVVGAVGSDLRMEYSALGDAINLAARMEQTAAPGTVQIAQDTYRLVKPLFEFEALGGVEVKGKSAPVPAYRVLARKAVAGRVRGIEGLNAALVGRQAELAGLRGILADLGRGVGRIVAVLGEAGIGKSRLIAEIRGASLTDGGPEWYETASLSYEAGTPYGLFQRLIRRMSGIAANERPATVREKISPLLESFEAERRERVMQVFEALFGLEDGNGRPPLEGETFRRELFDVMGRLWREQFARRPTVLVFDDMHWADAASVELLLHLLPLTGELPLVLLLAFRPDREAPAWRLRTTVADEYHHRYTEFALSPLSGAESDELVNRLLVIADLPERLRQGIIEKSGGNPFFVEEVVRSLIDSGAVVPEERGVDGRAELYWRATSQEADFDIPDNLQSLLTARVDRLEETTRATLQLASVIGRSFYHRVLQAVDVATQELDRHLATLLRLDMINEAARVPEVEYSFRNPLTQEAVYNTILLKRRREFHRRVGEAMEALFPDRLAELAPRLAHHFVEAQYHERALHYFTLAGDNAYRLYAQAEAVAQYTRAIELAQLQEAGPSEKLKYLFRRRGRALELASQFAEALANYKEMEALAQARGDRSLELAAWVLRATIYSTANDHNDPALGEQLSLQALELARELGDEEAEARIQWNLLNVWRFSTTRVAEAVAAGERALELSRKLDLTEQRAFVANDLPFMYLSNGQPELAADTLREAVVLWRELGNQPMLADSLSTSATVSAMSGEFEKALAFAAEAYRISKGINNLWGISYSRFCVGQVYLQLGELAEAVEAMQISITYGIQSGFIVARVWCQLYQALLYASLGQVERALPLAQSALDETVSRIPIYRAFGLGVLAHLYVLKGDLDKAAEVLQETFDAPLTSGPLILAVLNVRGARVELELARENLPKAAVLAAEVVSILQTSRLRAYLSDGLYLQGQALLAGGQVEAAEAVWRQARAEAEALGARWPLWQILAALSKRAVARGDSVEAEALRAQAAEIVDYIAAHAGDLREAYLALPEVQALTGATAATLAQPS